MIKDTTRVIFLLTISYLFNPGILRAQPKAYLINDDVAVFYPEDFIPDDHLPSFALLSEPEYYDDLPDNWPTKVEFYQSPGKSYASVFVGDRTDLYGTGEVTGSLLRNGTTRTLYNTDNFGYQRFHGTRLYQSHPWVLGVREDGTAFGVLADNTWRQEVLCGTTITFSSESSPFRVIVIEKNSPQEVVMELAELTGKMNLPPLWSLGYQQCRWSYYPDSRVKEIADTFRIKQIPCDVIWMDIHYMDAYKIFTFSEDRFPNPEETNSYLHEKGYKSIWMIDPGVKVEEGYSVYESGTEDNVWVKTKNGETYIGEVWPGDCVFPDFTQQKTQQWWSGLYKDFMARGIDGVWNDMNEPAVFNVKNFTIPDSNLHLGDDILEKDIHLRYHNVYGMMMVKASREGILNAKPENRPFILTRANFIGGQRYAATWTGDNVSTWKHLKMSIPMSITMGLSGQPFNGPDIGGFGGNATPELFGNWISLAAFYPFSRAHTVEGSIPHEPWAFGAKIEQVSKVSIEQRYRLLPYLYTKFYEASVNGLPIMQPLFFADTKDPDLRSEEEAFLVGNDLMVIPAWAKDAHLPKEEWTPFRIIDYADSLSEYMANTRIRPGAIIPLGKVIQNTTEYSAEDIELIICLDENGYATGKLYLDSGDGFEYKKGEFGYITITARKTETTVNISISEQLGDMVFPALQTKVMVIDKEKTISVAGNLAEGIKIKTRK